jgi:hypothetical protein
MPISSKTKVKQKIIARRKSTSRNKQILNLHLADAQGIKFRSQFEELHFKNSLLLGYKPKYEAEDEIIPYTIPQSEHKYLPDFVYTKKDGGKMIVETKGVWKLEDRKKWLFLIRQYPHLDLRIIFERPDNKIKKGSKTSYGDWCNKAGIKWAAKVMPAEWYKEIIPLAIKQ